MSTERTQDGHRDAMSDALPSQRLVHRAPRNPGFPSQLLRGHLAKQDCEPKARGVESSRARVIQWPPLVIGDGHQSGRGTVPGWVIVVRARRGGSSGGSTRASVSRAGMRAETLVARGRPVGGKTPSDFSGGCPLTGRRARRTSYACTGRSVQLATASGRLHPIAASVPMTARADSNFSVPSGSR